MNPNEFCPYVGLQPFTEEEREYFFGRERDTRIITSNLYASRLTVLYGVSGVGKSSVLMAGVLPALRTRSDTLVVLFREWQSPDAPRVLCQRVVEAADRAADGPLGLDPEQPLDRILKQAGDRLGTLVLILDQFEEYFLYHPEGSALDAELALAVNRTDLDANLLLSLREDSLSMLDRFKSRIPHLMANGLRLEHLDAKAAREAICRPVERYNERPEAMGDPATIEDALVEAVIAQVGSGQIALGKAEREQAPDPGQTERRQSERRIETPFLQLVLTKLWCEESNGDSHALRLQTLETLGGARQIVFTHLDVVMARLEAEDQELCARFFDRMVTPSGTKIACRLDDLAEWAEVPEPAVERLVRLLVENRILRAVPPLPGQPDQYEIFHDVIAPGILDWRNRYIQEEAQRQAARTAKEREQKAAEDEKLRAAQEVAQANRRAAQRLRIGLVATVVLSLIASGFGYVAWIQREMAVRKTSDLEEKTFELTLQSSELTRQKGLAETNLDIAREQAAIAFDARVQAEEALMIAQEKAVSAARAREEAEAQRMLAEKRTLEANKATASLMVKQTREDFLQDRDYDKTIADYLEALDLDPQNSKARYWLGLTFYERGLSASQQRGNGESTHGASAASATGDGDQGDFEQAVASLDRALQTAGEDASEWKAEVLAARAKAKRQLGDIAGALDDYRQAGELMPADAGYPYGAATILVEMGNQDAAEIAFGKAIELDPNFVDAFLARSELYLATGRTALAIADLKSAWKVADDDITRKAVEAQLKEHGVRMSTDGLWQGTLYIQYVEEADRKMAKLIAGALAHSGFETPPTQFVPSARTSGDVRYTGDRGKPTASAIARIAEETLAGKGFKVSFRLIRLDTRKFKDAKEGVYELWLPSLSQPIQQQMAY